MRGAAGRQNHSTQPHLSGRKAWRILSLYIPRAGSRSTLQPSHRFPEVSARSPVSISRGLGEAASSMRCNALPERRHGRGDPHGNAIIDTLCCTWTTIAPRRCSVRAVPSDGEDAEVNQVLRRRFSTIIDFSVQPVRTDHGDRFNRLGERQHNHQGRGRGIIAVALPSSTSNSPLQKTPFNQPVSQCLVVVKRTHGSDTFPSFLLRYALLHGHQYSGISRSQRDAAR